MLQKFDSQKFTTFNEIIGRH